MVHLANGGDNGLYRWFFDIITSRGTLFDVIGISFYSFWHGSLSDLQYNINDGTARYGKPVAVVELHILSPWRTMTAGKTSSTSRGNL
jgi:arabinogalactan endo-1,4-beta-galactosidase